MPSTGRIIKTNLGDLYDARIKHAYRQGYGEEPHELEQIYTVDSIDTQDVRYTHITGLPQWRHKGLGENVSFAAIEQGYDVTLTPATYALAILIEEETVEDDPHGLLGQDLARALAESGRETFEVLAAQPFNAPTSTAAYSPWMSGGDGVALLSTAHPIVTGGVYANKPATDASLGMATLAASKLRLQKMQGAHGQLWSLQAKTLVVPPDLEQRADELLGSDKVPYTGDNTLNVVRKGLTRFTWSRLTSATAWFCLAQKAPRPGAKGHGQVWIWRVKPQFARDNEFLSGDRRYKGRARAGAGNWDWRGVDGSTGA